MLVTPGVAWGQAIFILEGSLEEVECEQDAHTVIHIRPLRGHVSCAATPPRLRLGLFTFCPFRAGWYQFI